MQLLKSKKGAIAILSDIGIELVTFTLVITLGVLFIAQMGANSTVAANANATTVVNRVQTEYVGLSTWIGIVVIALIFMGLFGLVMAIRKMRQ